MPLGRSISAALAVDQFGTEAATETLHLRMSIGSVTQIDTVVAAATPV